MSNNNIRTHVNNVCSNLENYEHNNNNINNINSNNNGNTAFEFIDEECQNLFGTNFFSIIDKVKRFVPQYKMMTNSIEKKMSLIKFILSLVETP